MDKEIVTGIVLAVREVLESQKHSYKSIKNIKHLEASSSELEKVIASLVNMDEENE